MNTPTASPRAIFQGSSSRWRTAVRRRVMPRHDQSMLTASPAHGLQHGHDGQDEDRLEEAQARLVRGGVFQEDGGEPQGEGDEEDQEHALGSAEPDGLEAVMNTGSPSTHGATPGRRRFRSRSAGGR